MKAMREAIKEAPSTPHQVSSTSTKKLKATLP
jgi:hypothetical protein